jgi:hypothetical protein
MHSLTAYRRWLLAGPTIALFLIGIAGPANAAGSPSLDKYILTKPIPGWIPYTEAQSNRAVGYLENLEAAAISSSGATASVAAEGWRRPSSKDTLFIGLVGYTGATASHLSVDQQVMPAAKAAAASFCSGASASSPISTNPVSAIPDSYLVVCPSTFTGIVPVGVTWVKANVLAFMVTAQNSRNTETISSLAVKQYSAMPAEDTSLSSQSTGGITALVVVIALLVVLITMFILIRHRRKKSRESAGILRSNSTASAILPRAGWYQDPTNQDRRRYWTGTEWGPGEPEVPEPSSVTPPFS